MTSLRADVAKRLDECVLEWRFGNDRTPDFASFGAYATDALSKLLAERGVKVLPREPSIAIAAAYDFAAISEEPRLRELFGLGLSMSAEGYRRGHDAARSLLTTENGDG